MEGQEEGKNLSPKAKAGKGKAKKAGAASSPKDTAAPATFESASKPEEAKKTTNPKEGEESKTPTAKAGGKKSKKGGAKAGAGQAGKTEKPEATEIAPDSMEQKAAEEHSEDTTDAADSEEPVSTGKKELENASGTQVTQAKPTSDVITSLLLTAVSGKDKAAVEGELLPSQQEAAPASEPPSLIEGMVKAGLEKQNLEKKEGEAEQKSEEAKKKPEEAKKKPEEAKKKPEEAGQKPEEAVHKGEIGLSGTVKAEALAVAPEEAVQKEEKDGKALKPYEKAEAGPTPVLHEKEIPISPLVSEPPEVTPAPTHTEKHTAEPKSPPKPSPVPEEAVQKEEKDRKALKPHEKAEAGPMPVLHEKEIPISPIISEPFEVFPAQAHPEKHIAEPKSPPKPSPAPEEAKSPAFSIEKLIEKPVVAAIQSQEKPIARLPAPSSDPKPSDSKQPEISAPIIEVISKEVLKLAEKQPAAHETPAKPLPTDAEIKQDLLDPLAKASSLPAVENKQVAPALPVKDPLPETSEPSHSVETVIMQSLLMPRPPPPSTNLKVFLTGGTGAIGRAVLELLLASGHHVTCTAKDEAAQSTLQTAFAGEAHFTVVRFALSVARGAELTTLATGFDAIIHTAQSFLEDGHAMEETVLKAFAAAGKATAAQGRACHFIASSSLWVLGETGDTEVDEAGSTASPFQFAAWRVPMEQLVFEAAQPTIGFTTAVIRPSWVYGSSFVDQYIRVSVSKRQIIVPNADKRFETVHKDDLASLYRLVMEQRATGLFNGCEERTLSVEELTEKMMELGLTEVIRVDNPMPYTKDLGFFIVGMTVHQVVKPKRSLEIGWKPKHAFLHSFSQLYSHLAIPVALAKAPEQQKAEEKRLSIEKQAETEKMVLIEKQMIALQTESKELSAPKEAAKELPKEESKFADIMSSANASALQPALEEKQEPLPPVLPEKAPAKEESKEEKPLANEKASDIGSDKKDALTAHLVKELLVSKSELEKVSAENPLVHEEPSKNEPVPEATKPKPEAAVIPQHEPAGLPSVTGESKSSGAAASELPSTLPRQEQSHKPSKEKEEVEAEEVSESVEVAKPSEQIVGSAPGEELPPAQSAPVASQSPTDPLFASSISGSDLTTEKNSSWMTVLPAAQAPPPTQHPQPAPKEEKKESPTPQPQPKPTNLSAEKQPAVAQKADIMPARTQERPNPNIHRTPAPDHTSSKSCANCSLQ